MGNDLDRFTIIGRAGDKQMEVGEKFVLKGTARDGRHREVASQDEQVVGEDMAFSPALAELREGLTRVQEAVGKLKNCELTIIVNMPADDMAIDSKRIDGPISHGILPFFCKDNDSTRADIDKIVAYEHALLRSIANGDACASRTVVAHLPVGENSPEGSIAYARACYTLMCRTYLVPTRVDERSARVQYVPDERGLALVGHLERVPSIEALRASYMEEAVYAQHARLCRYLSRNVRGAAVTEAEVEFNGARWKAVIDFGEVVEAQWPATSTSTPVYGVDLYRNGDRLPPQFIVRGLRHSWGGWLGSPTGGYMVMSAGSLPKADDGVIDLLILAIRKAGWDVVTKHPDGWRRDASRPFGWIKELGTGMAALIWENPSALRLGIHKSLIVKDPSFTGAEARRRFGPIDKTWWDDEAVRARSGP